MKVSITYDDTLYQLVPKEPVQEQWGELARDIMMWLRWGQPTPSKLFQHLEMLGREIPQWLRDEPEMKNLDHVVSKGTCCVLIYRAMLSAAPTPPAQPKPQGSVWTVIAPDGTEFTGPTPLKAALPANKYRLENDPEAMDKFLQAIDQIAEDGRKEREQCMQDYGTLDCPHCGGSGHIADSVANGFPPPAQPAERMPLTLDQLSDLTPGTIRCAWSDFVSIARAIESAHGITAPKEPS